jgi:predicted lipid-binding transport protein (Tim44 family)
MESINLFTLILLVVAVVVILKLRSVLGRRTGDEEARLERYRAERRQQGAPAPAPASDNVVAMPRRDRDAPALPGVEVAQADAEERIKEYPGIGPEVRQGLVEIAKIDPAFDPAAFLRGARQAYEMVVTAFAEGNRKILKELLHRDVYDGFTRAIAERESRGEQVDQSFVGINKADIIESDVKGGIANITVRFVSQLISATRDRAGAILSGDPQRIKEVTDVWTFRRDISTPKARENPNWELVATQSPG